MIGKDTRLSGYMIEPALTAGFIAMGMDVILLGPLPTPAVAMLTRSLRADLGVMISASHNPFEDNGIKLFGPDGYKLSDDIEAEIEALMAQHGARRPRPSSGAPAARGRAGRYIELVKGSFPRGLRLDGLRIASIAPTAPPTGSRRPSVGARRQGRAARRLPRWLQHQWPCGATTREHCAPGAWRMAPISAWRSMATPTAWSIADEMAR